MACDANTLIANAASRGFQALSARDLKLAALYLLCAGPAPGTTAQQAIVLAYAAGYDRLSDRMIDEAMLAVLCP
jgi:hypothetical protein